MAWANSKIFTAYIENSLERTAAFDLDADAFKAALFNNSPTPDQTVAAASSAFNTGQWVTANEVAQAVQWPTGGVALSGISSGVSANVFTFDAADTASGSAATLANVYGALIYDDTLTTPVADQGVCYNYFGGANSVVNGTFTVVWNAAGIFTITL